MLWLVPVSLLGSLVLLGPRLTQVSDAPLLVAEDLSASPPRAGASPSAASDVDPIPESVAVQPSASRVSARLKRRADALVATETKSAEAAAPALDAPLPAASASAPADAANAAAPGPASAELAGTPGQDCLSLARLGKTRDAEACFLKRAEGSGLGAEMALYEVARLRRDVLADADGALRALAEYRSRFPAGSLRREADMSQLELLVQLGRSEDALKQSAELLASSASGERAAELHLLRGHILRKGQAKFAAAALEYELAEKAGARGAEAKYFRALCLEALGRVAEAAALLTEYLAQPRRPYSEDAKRRLEKLKP